MTAPIQDEERRNQVIAEFAPGMLWMSNLTMLHEWFNQSWLVFTGRTSEQELGNGWRAGIHPEDVDRYIKAYTEAFADRQSFCIDFRLRFNDGTYRWITTTGKPHYTSEGEFSGFIANCMDIHERKELEWILEEANKVRRTIISESDSSKRLYEAILSSTPDFVYVFDLNHKFTYANEILLRVWGKTFYEAIGKSCLELGYEPWHAEMHDKEIETVIKTKKPIRGEVPFEGTSGRRIYDYIFVPVIGLDGNVEAVAGTTRDVTERYEIDEKIKKNQHALQLADRRKDEFLAMLAHELRNPLAPISAAAQVMVMGELDENRVRKSSQIIHRQVKHMAGLIDDLLDVSRVTRGLVTIENAVQNIQEIVSNSVEQVRPLIDAKQQHLIIELAPGPAYVTGDLNRLVQIFSNVLNNAAKYTMDGGLIRIEMKLLDDSVSIKIADSGIGILKEDQESIFDLFAQAHRSSDRSQGGLGIGLALVRTMVGLHGGSIECFSEGLGLGSEFTITFPLLVISHQSVETKESEMHLSRNVKQLKILVVDDNEDAADVLASFLELSGHIVTMENDSFKALDAAISQKPDVCILDIGLPRMDGNELAKRIKSNQGMENTVLIAATGYGQESDHKLTKASGFDYHLVKPLDIQQLSDILSGLHN